MNTHSLTKAKELVLAIMRSGQVPLLVGNPGEAKSSMGEQLAQEKHLIPVRIYGSLCDQYSFIGFPYQEGGVAKMAAFDTFPTVNTQLPEGKRGFLLIVDEFLQADEDVQKLFMSLFLDRTVNGVSLHPKCHIIAMSNYPNSGTGTTAINRALDDRIFTIPVKLEVSEWTAWASENGVLPEIIGYVNYDPSKFNTFNNSKAGKFASARGYASLSKAIKAYLSKAPSKTIHDVPMSLFEARLGSVVAVDLQQYLTYYSELPQLDHVLANPHTFIIPTKSGILWALVSKLNEALDIKAYHTFIIQIMLRLFDEGHGEHAMIMLQKAKKVITSDTSGYKDLLQRYGNFKRS